MSTEIEAKVKIVGSDDLIRIISFLAGRPTSVVIEENIYLDTPKRKLDGRGESLRIRKEHSADCSGPNAVITFKGPLLKGKFKQREETEFEVPWSEGHKLEEMFEKLGYTQTFYYQKHRTYVHGPVEVVIDHVPEIGTFVEVEGDTEEDVMGMLTALNLDDRTMIKDGYPKLLRQCRRANDFRFDVMSRMTLQIPPSIPA